MTLPSRISDHELADLPLTPALDALRDEILAADRRDVVPRRRWPAVVAAAASIAVVVSVPAYLATRDGDAALPTSPAGPASTVTPTTPATPTPDATPPAAAVEPWVGPTDFYVLDAPGWTILADEVTSDRSSVSIGYVNGSRRLELEWTVAGQWRGVRDSAARESPLSPIEVLGVEGQYVEYESQQQMVYLPPVDGYGVRIDGTFTSPAEFRALLGDLRPAPVPELPGSVVTPAEADGAVSAAVARVEVPDGFTLPDVVGWNSPYAVAYAVLEDVGCAWAHQYADGTPAERAAARTALEQSPRWDLLHDPAVDYPDWFVDSIVARIRAGASDHDVLAVAGCTRSEPLAGDLSIDGAPGLTEGLTDQESR